MGSLLVSRSFQQSPVGEWVLYYDMKKINMGWHMWWFRGNNQQGLGNTPRPSLISAAEKGDIEALSRLLSEKEADPNVRDSGGRTALMCAIIKKSEKLIEIVTLLLDKGADPNLLDANRHGALTFAANLGLPDITCILIDFGAEIDVIDDDDHTPRHVAANRLKRAAQSNAQNGEYENYLAVSKILCDVAIIKEFYQELLKAHHVTSLNSDQPDPKSVWKYMQQKLKRSEASEQVKLLRRTLSKDPPNALSTYLLSNSEVVKEMGEALKKLETGALKPAP
jgi:hypothetical protein